MGEKKKKKDKHQRRDRLWAKFKKEDVNDEEYPPLFQFGIIRDIGLCLPV